MKCIGENTEKYISFSVNVQEDIDNNDDVDEEEERKPKNYRLRFIDCFSFMNFSLDSLRDNLSEINYKTCVKCKERIKSVQYCKFIDLSNKKSRQKCLKCNDISYKSIKPLIEKFPNTYRLSNEDNQKFILLIRKGVYPYEYIDDWSKLNETELPSKNAFHSNLNMNDISHKDYNHAKSVFNIFNMRNLGDYHDLYVPSDTLLLSDIFEEFRKTCIKEY